MVSSFPLGTNVIPINVNLLGSSHIIIAPFNKDKPYIKPGKNTIRIANGSTVTGRPKPPGVGNTWDLYEISIQDWNGKKYEITDINDKYTGKDLSVSNFAGLPSNLIDNNDSTFWAYRTDDTDLDGSPNPDVKGLQWVEFSFSYE